MVSLFLDKISYKRQLLNKSFGGYPFKTIQVILLLLALLINMFPLLKHLALSNAITDEEIFQLFSSP